MPKKYENLIKSLRGETIQLYEVYKYEALCTLYTLHSSIEIVDTSGMGMYSSVDGVVIFRGNNPRKQVALRFLINLY